MTRRTLPMKIYKKNISFRDLEELLLSSGDMCRVLGLRAVPDYLTIGFKEDRASFYYALRSGKKSKRWIKAFHLLDIGTQVCVSQVVCRRPGCDAPYPRHVENKSIVRPIIEVMDRGFDGNENFHFGLPIRVIPSIRREGGIKSWNRILVYMVYMVSRFMGIYCKRWLCEPTNSVIKRKFGDSVRERKEKNKKTIVSLMTIAYNIHMMVRGEGNLDFFFASEVKTY